MSIVRIKELIEQGEYQEALEEVQQLPDDEKLEGKILKGRILIWKSNFQEVLAITE